jgi:hypothetical protein
MERLVLDKGVVQKVPPIPASAMQTQRPERSGAWGPASDGVGGLRGAKPPGLS